MLITVYYKNTIFPIFKLHKSSLQLIFPKIILQLTKIFSRKQPHRQQTPNIKHTHSTPPHPFVYVQPSMHLKITIITMPIKNSRNSYTNQCHHHMIHKPFSTRYIPIILIRSISIQSQFLTQT